MGHIEIVKLLLNDPRIEINALNIPGDSALSKACEHIDNNNVLDIIELLLKHPDIDPNNPKSHYSVIRNNYLKF